MSSTPPEPGAPDPAGYKAGDYIPFEDRDPSNPSAIAGQWADPALQAQMTGSRRPSLTPQEQYRAIYGFDAPDRVELRVVGPAGARLPRGLVPGRGREHPAVHRLLDGDRRARVQDRRLRQPGHRHHRREQGDDRHPGARRADLPGLRVWNSVIRQGRTGYTLGKAAVGIRLVGVSSGEPIGAGLSFLRQLAHVVDSLVCYLGWLWPLWDSRNQTLADKIMGTVVVIQPAAAAVLATGLHQTGRHVDHPDHRRVLRARRRDGPPVRRQGTRPRALRAAYRTARGAPRRDPRRPAPKERSGGSSSARST